MPESTEVVGGVGSLIDEDAVGGELMLDVANGFSDANGSFCCDDCCFEFDDDDEDLLNGNILCRPLFFWLLLLRLLNVDVSENFTEFEFDVKILFFESLFI